LVVVDQWWLELIRHLIDLNGRDRFREAEDDLIREMRFLERYVHGMPQGEPLLSELRLALPRVHRPWRERPPPKALRAHPDLTVEGARPEPIPSSHVLPEYPMTNRDQVLAFLRSIVPRDATNEEIVGRTGVRPHQQVFRITRELMDAGVVRGSRSGREMAIPCRSCNDGNLQYDTPPP
jgi:hypothetical protein